MIYPGSWDDAIVSPFPDLEVDAVITDPPFSERTHAGQRITRRDAPKADWLTEAGLGYDFFTPADAERIVELLEPRCRGWFCVMSDHVLLPAYERALERSGRMVFAPVPIVMRGSSCRMNGDGPSSWSVYMTVARPRTKAFATWGTLPGAYVTTRPERTGLKGTKPVTLMAEIVADYTRPGDVVFDPFAGSGTTLIAARELGRSSLGCEVRFDALQVAQERTSKPWTPRLV